MIGIVRCTDHLSTIDAEDNHATSSALNDDNLVAVYATNSTVDAPSVPAVADSSTVSGEAEAVGGESSSDNTVNPPRLLVVNQHLFRPATVLILGDSFIRRVKEYSYRTFGPYSNLGFHYNVANVCWYGIGGLTLTGLRNNHMHAIYDSRPDVVFIHLGSNDLTCPHADPLDLGFMLEELVNDLFDSHVKQVIVSQMLFRNRRGVPVRMSTDDYNRRITLFNHFNKLTFNVNTCPAARFWFHIGLWNQQVTTLAHDGVHLNARGNKNFLRSIRGAVIQGVSRARPNLTLPQVTAPYVPAIREW